MYIYQAIRRDEKTTPATERIVREFPTERETLEYLKIHGGTYRNILDNVTFDVKKEALTVTYYKTFKRSCKGWAEFSSARKMTEDTGLTLEQARQRCDAFNDHRTPAQIRKGTKLEFTEM